jgi:3-oxoacyl-[acyl-carrier protein] reductase
MRLKGKVAIVTGGGSGFGAGIVAKFVAEGAQVVVADLNLQAALDVAAAAGPAARGLRVDVAKAADVRLMMETAELHFGRIDILVNNAGVTHLPQPLEEVSEDDFDRIVAVNMKAIYLAMREVVPRMKANAPGAKGIRGVVLNMASTAGVSPRPRLGWYNASKGWVITATRANAVELAPSGIRVVALNPVAGETPLLKSFMGQDTPEVRAKFLSTIPIGRFSTPEDLGNAACFLCSDEASMITGVCMEVDGGRCICRRCATRAPIQARAAEPASPGRWRTAPPGGSERQRARGLN